MAFTNEELQNLRDIFDLFDKDKNGYIGLDDLQHITQSLKRDFEEAKSLLEQVDPNHDGKLTFDEFLHLMGSLEQAEEDNLEGGGSGEQEIKADSKIIDFLRLLEEYRRKCEKEGNYAEARKAEAKYGELMKKEALRQKQNIRSAQEQEL